MSGRHRDPDRGSFWRSLGVAVGKALLVLVVLGGVTALAVVLGSGGLPAGDGLLGDSGLAADEDAAPEPVETSEPAVTPTSEPTQTDAVATPRPAGQPTSTPTPVSAAALTVQVLDGGAGPDAADEVAAALDDAGYEVVAVNPARCCEAMTTIYHAADRVADAEQVQALDARFRLLEVNQRFDASVPLHVVLGEDWADEG